jgi:hypothetical protein
VRSKKGRKTPSFLFGGVGGGAVLEFELMALARQVFLSLKHGL